MKYLLAGMCLCVYTHLGQKITSRLEIVGVRVDVRAVELECFCVAEIDCVVAKNNEAVEGQIRKTGRNQHLHNTASRD